MSDLRSPEVNSPNQLVLEMTRRLTFSAAYSEPGIRSAARNKIQAHNYVLDVRVRGAVDPRTGIIINIKILDAIVREQVISELDSRDLTHHCAFENCRISLSTILNFIHEQLKGHIPPEVMISGLRLEESAESWADWLPSYEQRKSRKEMFLVTRSYEFSASHRLDSSALTPEENLELFGKCNYPNGHGHNYILEVTVEGAPDAKSGQIIDIAELDDIVNREIVDRYDHRHLNYDIPEFEGKIPSAEIITKVIWDRLSPYVSTSSKLYRILLRETARNIFEYYAEGI